MCRMPLITRRSSTRSLPRTSIGKNGLIFCHCSSLSQNKLLLMMIPRSPSAENHYPIQPSTLLLSFGPSKIDEALNGVHSAHMAASLEAITHLYRASGSEHGDIIEGFIAHASVRPV